MDMSLVAVSRKETVCRTGQKTTYRRLSTQSFVKVGHGKGRGRSLLLGRGERRSAGNEGGEDGSLHGGNGRNGSKQRIQQEIVTKVARRCR